MALGAKPRPVVPIEFDIPREATAGGELNSNGQSPKAAEAMAARPGL